MLLFYLQGKYSQSYSCFKKKCLFSTSLFLVSLFSSIVERPISSFFYFQGTKCRNQKHFVVMLIKRIHTWKAVCNLQLSSLETYNKQLRLGKRKKRNRHQTWLLPFFSYKLTYDQYLSFLFYLLCLWHLVYSMKKKQGRKKKEVDFLL